MDPDQTLKEARDAVSVIMQAEDPASDFTPEEVAAAHETLAGAFAALDEWLLRGGFLPASWRR